MPVPRFGIYRGSVRVNKEYTVVWYMIAESEQSALARAIEDDPVWHKNNGSFRFLEHVHTTSESNFPNTLIAVKD